MVEQYGVSRASLREALRLLEVQGLISLKPGPGGGRWSARSSRRNLARTAALYFHLGGATYADAHAHPGADGADLRPARGAATRTARRRWSRCSSQELPDDAAGVPRPHRRLPRRRLPAGGQPGADPAHPGRHPHRHRTTSCATMDPVELRAAILDEHAELARRHRRRRRRRAPTADGRALPDASTTTCASRLAGPHRGERSQMATEPVASDSLTRGQGGPGHRRQAAASAGRWCWRSPRAGADVVITSRKSEACKAVAEEVEATTGRRAFVASPATSATGTSSTALVDAAYAEFGRVDVLVNNAGMSPLYPSLVERHRGAVRQGRSASTSRARSGSPRSSAPAWPRATAARSSTSAASPPSARRRPSCRTARPRPGSTRSPSASPRPTARRCG